MELSDEAKAEIAAAVKILREDGVHIHKSYAAFQKSQEEKTDPKPEGEPPADPKTEGEGEPTEGTPPPVKDTPKEKPKKRSLWWGDLDND